CDAATESGCRRARSEDRGTSRSRSIGAVTGAILCRRGPASEVREDVYVKLTVVGCSPAWPNPGGAQSGYLVEGPGRLLLDCGPGVLARLREQEGWPQVDAIAITHFHLDHWGDVVPWVWGRMFGLGRDYGTPELWLQPGGRDVLRSFGERMGQPDMFDRTFTIHEYAEDETFTAAGFEITPIRLPHYTLLTFGFRVSN